MTIDSSRFIRNHATSGDAGAIFTTGSTTSLAVTNTASTTSGAIYNTGKNLVATDNVFLANTAPSQKGKTINIPTHNPGNTYNLNDNYWGSNNRPSATDINLGQDVPSMLILGLDISHTQLIMRNITQFDYLNLTDCYIMIFKL